MRSPHTTTFTWLTEPNSNCCCCCCVKNSAQVRQQSDNTVLIQPQKKKKNSRDRLNPHDPRSIEATPFGPFASSRLPFPLNSDLQCIFSISPSIFCSFFYRVPRTLFPIAIASIVVTTKYKKIHWSKLHFGNFFKTCPFFLYLSPPLILALIKRQQLNLHSFSFHFSLLLLFCSFGLCPPDLSSSETCTLRENLLDI